MAIQLCNTKQKRFLGLFRFTVWIACLLPGFLLATNYYAAYYLSNLFVAIVLAVLSIVGVYTARQYNRQIAVNNALPETGKGMRVLRIAVAALLGGATLYPFYTKYIASLYETGRQTGRLAEIYLRIPWNAHLKFALVVLLLLTLFLLCTLGIYCFLCVAYYRQEKVEKGEHTKQIRTKLFKAYPVMFCFFFTVMFFGPVDIVLENTAYLIIHARDIWLALLLFSVFAALLVSLLLVSLEQGMFRLVLSLLFGITLAMYFQGTYFNTDLGTLNGSLVKWRSHWTEALIGAALWVVLVGIQPILHRVLQDKYTKATTMISAVIVVMQTVALAVMLLSGQQPGTYYALDGAETFHVSAKENVIVFTLDTLDNDTMDKVLEDYPQTREALKDFIYFDNTSSMYPQTFPSLCCLLTGVKYDPTKPVAEYIDTAWHGDKAKRFYRTLEQRGFRRNLFIDANYTAIDAKNMEGKADNVQKADLGLTPEILASVVRLSAVRYAPLCIKEKYWTTTEHINKAAAKALKEVSPLILDHDFYSELKERGLTVSDKDNYFVWHHLFGPHPPYEMDEFGHYFAGQKSDQYRQAQGYLLAVEQYLQDMKTYGIYEDATIIISTDHGRWTCLQSALLVKRPHQTNEALVISHAPASQMDVMPTILDCIGEEYASFGNSVFDLKEDMIRQRETCIMTHNDQYPPVKWIGSFGQLHFAEIGYNVMDVYRYTGDKATIMEQYESGKPSETIPLYDSFY